MHNRTISRSAAKVAFWRLRSWMRLELCGTSVLDTTRILKFKVLAENRNVDPEHEPTRAGYTTAFAFGETRLGAVGDSYYHGNPGQRSTARSSVPCCIPN